MRFQVIDPQTGQAPDLEAIVLNAATEERPWTGALVYCDMQGFAIEEDGSLLLLDKCGNYASCPEGRFEVRWEAPHA